MKPNPAKAGPDQSRTLTRAQVFDHLIIVIAVAFVSLVGIAVFAVQGDHVEAMMRLRVERAAQLDSAQTERLNVVLRARLATCARLTAFLADGGRSAALSPTERDAFVGDMLQYAAACSPNVRVSSSRRDEGGPWEIWSHVLVVFILLIQVAIVGWVVLRGRKPRRDSAGTDAEGRAATEEPNVGS